MSNVWDFSSLHRSRKKNRLMWLEASNNVLIMSQRTISNCHISSKGLKSHYLVNWFIVSRSNLIQLTLQGLQSRTSL